jgi:stage II sporulation protein M
MKKIVTKVKNKVKLDKNLSVFLFVLLIVGLISGSIFASILNDSDKFLVTEHLNSFLTNIEQNKLDYLTTFKNNLLEHLLNTIIIWLLGISVIGLPIIIVMYFSKSFILGFTIGCIINTFKFKGVLFALIYTFPFEIINILVLMLLVMYSMSFSFKMIYSVFKKKTIDFKIIINKYLIILIISIISNIISCIYNSYLLPIIMKSLITFIR